ncbi:MAG: hypothetical protein KDA61_21785, partial [Planctomycetales bacterium]|nr:hypothetical protein [Planctomycetales bacterium]
WFETDWQCDYQFAPSRFANPRAMIDDLKRQGFRVSLWQLPYFTQRNRLHDEISDQGYAVRNARGLTGPADSVLDFSNERTVGLYQSLIAGLLRQGVGAIKVDFGEDAPLDGQYASGRTGWYEHNLYPLRYNQTVAEVTENVAGENIIWARSAWAGSQRYPVHWSGDAENSDSAMAATLRAGLSLGLTGFTYWSHDVGGFVERPSLDLYRRWLAFGALTSHTRCHGAPPREPWEYGPEFVDEFRRIIGLKYALLPYLYAEATAASEVGSPLLRPLFFEFPNDPGSWHVDDQYLLGRQLLVAPLFESGVQRRVYLPPGQWIDYQTHAVYHGPGYRLIPAEPLPIVLLVRAGATLPHVKVAPHTGAIDWNHLSLHVYGETLQSSAAHLVLPDGRRLEVALQRRNGPWELVETRAQGDIDFAIEAHP